MSSLPSVFQKASTEFPEEGVSIPNRQWIQDAMHSEDAADAEASFDVRKLTSIFHMTHTGLRERLYQLFLDEADFHAVSGESLSGERARVMRQWGHIAQGRYVESSISARTAEGAARYDAVIESCGMVSHGLEIKMSVHYGLFGATLAMMGDDAQAAEWVPKVERCEMLGCFALTELGHGSNVRGIETTAHYLPDEQMFVLNTPTESAQKYWIGGAYKTARWTATFAQLYMPDGTCHGIHPFLTRLRYDDGTLVPGVTLADCGHKCGMNGVDNGRIWFDHVRVPHKHLLRRFSQVSVDGMYSSTFKSADERFGTSLASLSGGRVSVASSALNQSKIGLAIALRYALQRKAFGPVPGASETRLLDYPLHQQRLIPLLATTVTMRLVHNRLKARWHARDLGKYLHVWSSGFKALMSWHALQTLQECREACGGQGYKAENRIGELKSSHDVALTYEGDNHILLQAVAKSVLPDFVQGMMKMKATAKQGGFEKDSHFAYLNEHERMKLGTEINMSAETTRDLQGFVLKTLQRREGAVFAMLATRITELRKVKGMSSMNAFNECADLVEQAGIAHTELVMLQVFFQQLDDAAPARADSGLRNILTKCAQLMFLARIDKQPIFLRVSALHPKQALKVHDEIAALCKELRPQVLHLVNAFGIPPHLLSPIAFDYIAHNSKARI